MDCDLVTLTQVTEIVHKEICVEAAAHPRAVTVTWNNLCGDEHKAPIGHKSRQQQEDNIGDKRLCAIPSA